jgi:hypothetical protein
MDEEDFKKVIWGIKRHPDEHLGISLPGYLHHETNWQARLRHYDYHHPGGWLPCGDNWWRFKQTRRQYVMGVLRHIAMNKSIRKQGFDLYDTQEPLFTAEAYGVQGGSS